MTWMIGGVTAGTASLCLVAVTHTYLLFHCLPYVGYMAVTLPHFDSNGRWQNYVVTVDNVGWYAGWLGTAFTTGRCLSFLPWKMARKINPKGSLLASLLLSTICSIWFGMSRTFSSAIVARFMLGLSNTLSACVKRIALDRAKDAAMNAAQASNQIRFDSEDMVEKSEEMAPGKVLSMMWWGSAIGPVMGGMLANPGTFSEDTFLPEEVEVRYPYLLPNLVGALLCTISIVGVYFFVNDTTDSLDETSKGARAKNDAQGELRPLLQTGQTDKQNSDLKKENFPDWDAIRIIWEGHNTRWHLLAYWAFSFAVVCMDEALPLFLIARMSGPGLSPRQIGWIFSVGTLMSIFRHHSGMENILSEDERGIGLYPCLKVSSVLGNAPYVLIPLMMTINGGAYYDLVDTSTTDDVLHDDNEMLPGESGGLSLGEAGRLNLGSFIFMVMLLGFTGLFNSSYFSLIGVATGRTVPPSYRDQVARISTIGALCARAVAPVFAGGVVATFMATDDGGDAVWLWIVLGLLLGLGAAFFTFQIKETGAGNKKFRESRSKRASLYLDKRQRAQVYVRLWEVRYDKGSNTVAAKWRRLARKAIVYNRMQGDFKKTDEDSRQDGEEDKGPRRSSWLDHILRPGLDVDRVSFFILGTFKDDQSCSPHVLTPPLMEVLHQYLPMSCAETNFYLKYSLVRDGSSLHSLETKVFFSENTFIAIETLDGDVFGCFMTKPWRKTNKYEMSAQSFLWKMKQRRITPPNPADPEGFSNEAILDEIQTRESDVEIYRWTGENDDCQLFCDDRLAVGGGMADGNDGFGFILDGDLSSGTSSPCRTYNNPTLVASKDGRFEVANMEVWTMTPFLFVADAEKSEETMRFIHDNMMTDALGHRDAPSAAHSAWTNFL